MNERKKIHFIGIGGIGMSGLAEAFHFNGYSVQGSDIKKTKITDRLEKLNIRVWTPHSADNVKGTDYVVYSSCIKEDNEEIRAARQGNIAVLRRIEALNMLVGSKKRLVAVSGAHGKTTTTSLVSFLLIEAGLDPTVFIGADVDFLSGNTCHGNSDLVVTEADESDGSFLLLNPLYSISTNIDREHIDYYLSMDKLIASYEKFIENTKDKGAAFICMDDYYLKDIAKKIPEKVITYGIVGDADIKAENIKLNGFDGSSFDLVFKGRKTERMVISLPGVHNILNSLAAIGVALELGVKIPVIKEIIGGFKGADRRFVVKRLSCQDILIIDDYAHHPTEIKATLKNLENSGRRIVAVFQPHRYSRTKYLRDDFGTSFDLVDHLFITDIYSAHEVPIEGVSSKDICESAKRYGHKNVNFTPRSDVVKNLKHVVRSGDAVFILGAGDIGEIVEELCGLFDGEAGDCKNGI